MNQVKFKQKTATEIIEFLKEARAMRPDESKHDPYKTTKTVGKVNAIDMGLNIGQDLVANMAGALTVGLAGTALGGHSKLHTPEDIAKLKESLESYNHTPEAHTRLHNVINEMQRGGEASLGDTMKNIGHSFRRDGYKKTMDGIKAATKTPAFKDALSSFKNSQKILIPAGLGLTGLYTLNAYNQDRKDLLAQQKEMKKTAAVIEQSMPHARPEDIPGTYWWIRSMMAKKK